MTSSNGSRRVDVAAYYFPGFHQDPATSRTHGSGWSEWKVMAAARPRFDGHRQPRVSLWGEFDESDPRWAQKQAELAHEHGVDVFIFDWYWYEGGSFLNAALDKGFLATSETPVQFAIMWANHDWLNLHPAGRAFQPEVLFNGAVSDEEFDAMCEHIIEHYFRDPRYYTIEGAPYFSIYEPQTLIDGFGSVERASRAIDRMRARTIAAGFPDLHLNVVVTDRAVLPGEQMTKSVGQMSEAFGVASATSYVWIHHYDPSVDGFPLGSYAHAASANERVWAQLQDELEVPYFPNVTVGWDSSPRTVQSDIFEPGDYPWMAILDGSPAEFEGAFRKAMRFALASPSGSPALVTINAWNEWTEGSYLLPDEDHGYGFLQAIQLVRSQEEASPSGVDFATRTP